MLCPILVYRSELQEEFKKLGADTVYAFQLRNPVHNGTRQLRHRFWGLFSPHLLAGLQTAPHTPMICSS